MDTEFKTAAAYIRVSTDRQTELSPDSQIKVIKQFAKQSGYIVPNEYIYRDDGISGRSADKRPAFNSMIADAKQAPPPFSAILVWKFSRFARNQEEAIVYKSMLKKNGVAVISCSESLDDSPYSSLIERIIEWMDEYYSIRLSGEVKRGMTEKVQRGQPVSVPAFGYDIVDKEYIINEQNALIVRKIYSDYLNGKGTRKIASELNNLGIKTTRGNNWENRTVEYILQNPVYAGKIRWNTKGKTRRNYDDENIIITQGTHEPIIDQEVFDKVQELVAYNHKRHSHYTHSTVKSEYMLHGLIKCSNCGSSMTMSAKGQGLQCIKYAKGTCKESHYISMGKINELVLIGIEKAFSTETIKLNIRNKTENKDNYIDYNTLIEKEHKKLERIKAAYAEGIYTVDELREYKQVIEQQINALTVRQKSTTVNETALRKELIKKNKKLLYELKNRNLSEQEKNNILKGFVDKIYFDRRNSSVDIFFYI